MTAETTQDGGLSHSVKIWLYISFPIYYAEAKAFYSGFIASFKLKLVLKQFTINLKCQFNSTHSSQEPLTAGPKLRHGNWFSNGLIPPWILRWSTEKEAVMTHAVIPQFLYDVVRILPKCDKACNKSCLPSISLPAAGSRQGKPPQAKCYSSLLVFEVTASSAAEAAACGLWLVGLLKIWSLTFQVRMSHRHWSHNCSCEITQARWEERTSEQTCGLDSLSDNTTVCVCVSVHDVFPYLPTHALMQPLAERLLLPLLLSETLSKNMPYLSMSLYTCHVLAWQSIFIPLFIVTMKNSSVCIQTKQNE